MEEMGEALLHPKQLLGHVAHNLFFHGMTIYRGVKGGLSDYRTEQYEAAGREFGNAAALLLWGKPKMGS